MVLYRGRVQLLGAFGLLLTSCVGNNEQVNKNVSITPRRLLNRKLSGDIIGNSSRLLYIQDQRTPIFITPCSVHFHRTSIHNEKRRRNIRSHKAYSHSILILHPLLKYHYFPAIKPHILSPILSRSPYQLCLCTSGRYPQRSCFSSSIPEDVCRHWCGSIGCWPRGRRRWKRLVE